MSFINGSGFIATKITALPSQPMYCGLGFHFAATWSKTKTGFQFRQNQLSSEQKPWLSLGCVGNIMNNVLATNISPLEVCLRMIFLFPIWDMDLFPGGYSFLLNQGILYSHGNPYNSLLKTRVTTEL